MSPAAPASTAQPQQPRDRSLADGSIDQLLALADRCVQCGLCLPHCPTYRLDRAETESPRGRIALSRALADGSLQPDPRADAHLDHCLGCRRCEAACPAGVRYGELLVQTRKLQRERRGAPLRQRAIEWLVGQPALLDRLLGAYRTLYPVFPKVLPKPPARQLTTLHAPASEAEPANRIAIFSGCVARRYDAGTHAALVRLCATVGVTATIPADQTCCGTLHAHAGNREEAARLARCNRAAFTTGVPVLTTATGCHEAIVDALDGHAPTQDAFAFLFAHAERMRFRPARMRVALHVPCTQRAVVKSDRAMRDLLARIPGLDLVELPDTGCCGAAGTHMLAESARASALRQPLLDAWVASGASMLLSANVGCRLHLAMGNAKIAVRHPLEFLAEHLSDPSST